MTSSASKKGTVVRTRTFCFMLPGASSRPVHAVCRVRRQEVSDIKTIELPIDAIRLLTSSAADFFHHEGCYQLRLGGMVVKEEP